VLISIFELTSSICPNAMLWLLRRERQVPIDLVKNSSTLMPFGDQAPAFSVAAELPVILGCKDDFDARSLSALDSTPLEDFKDERTMPGPVKNARVHTVMDKRATTDAIQ
jgi:hypothetical protein